MLLAYRPFGIAAFAWVTLVIAFPRMYLGIHWPTDIIAGAAVGIVLGWIGNSPIVRDAARTYVVPLADSWPAPFYAGMFLVMIEVMNLFDDGHAIWRFLDHAAKNIL